MKGQLKHSVRLTIQEHGLLAGDEPVLVAVSGGVDSMVLLDVLHHMGYACTAAHLDHGLRGAQGTIEQRSVKELCAVLGIPFVGHTLEPGILEQDEGSVQMAAREARYSWLKACARKRGISAIAMAHHRDDSLETLFLNLLRGAGVAGWAGIPYRSGPIIRPLLDVTKEAIIAHAQSFQIPFHEDPSNADAKYLRNRIRHELFPLLSDLAPGWQRTTTRSLDRLRDLVAHAQRTMEAEHGTSASEVLHPADHDIPMRLLLHHKLLGKGFHPDAIDDMARALKEQRTGARFRSIDHEVSVDRGRLLIDRRLEPEPFSAWLERDQPLPSGAPIQVEWGPFPGAQDPSIWLDTGRLGFPIEVRTWRPGDRMRPSRGSGSRKISDMLTDAKVPITEKERTCVVVSQGDIALLVGHRAGDGFEARIPGGAAVRFLSWKDDNA